MSLFYGSIPVKQRWSKLKIVVVGFTCVPAVVYGPLKNTFFADYFVKKSTLLSDDNKLVRLPNDLHQFADDIRKEARMINPSAREKIKFFLTKGLDSTCLGNLNLRGGAKLGIPYNFIYDKPNDVDPKVITSLVDGIQLKLKTEDWYKTEDGKKLINSLVLSKEAKKYAILRGIVSADSEFVFYKDFLTFFSVIGALGIYELSSPTVIRYLGSFGTAIILGPILAITFACLASLALEGAYHFCEKSVDARVLIKSDEDDRKGCLEYYDKLIERNKLLREMLVDGHQQYDEDGNPNPYFQMIYIGKTITSLKERLDNCKDVIKAYKVETPII